MTLHVHKIGILGTGQMGSGIAQVAAQSKFEVLLADQNRNLAEKAKSRIALQLKKQVEKGKLSEIEEKQTLDNIRIVDGLNDLSQAHLVIEAVTEKPELKFQIFRSLSEVCQPD